MTFPLSGAARRLVETLNREIDNNLWPGTADMLLDTMVLIYHATDIVQSFKLTGIKTPSDMDKLDDAYGRLRGRYLPDAVLRTVESSSCYRRFGNTWGLEVNKQELAFLLFEAPSLVNADEFAKLLSEGAGHDHSLAWVIAACRRTHDRRQAGNRRLRLQRERDLEKLSGLSRSKEPVSSDIVASMLDSFRTSIRDAQIIKEHETTEEHRND